MLFFCACDKKPLVSFISDKQEYIAGEKIQLTNTSQKSYSYKWELPDGGASQDVNVEYAVPADFGFGIRDFKLEAFSKHSRKSASKSISITVVPQSYINFTGAFNKLIKFGHASKAIDYQANYIRIAVFTDHSTSFPYCTYDDVWLNFIGTQLPVPGTYSLNNEAGITYLYGACELPGSYISASGTLTVNYLNDRLHIFFNNIDTKTAGVKMSGEIFLTSNF